MYLHGHPTEQRRSGPPLLPRPQAEGAELKGHSHLQSRSHQNAPTPVSRRRRPARPKRSPCLLHRASQHTPGRTAAPSQDGAMETLQSTSFNKKHVWGVFSPQTFTGHILQRWRKTEHHLHVALMVSTPHLCSGMDPLVGRCPSRRLQGAEVGQILPSEMEGT